MADDSTVALRAAKRVPRGPWQAIRRLTRRRILGKVLWTGSEPIRETEKYQQQGQATGKPPPLRSKEFSCARHSKLIAAPNSELFQSGAQDMHRGSLREASLWKSCPYVNRLKSRGLIWDGTNLCLSPSWGMDSVFSDLQSGCQNESRDREAGAVACRYHPVGGLQQAEKSGRVPIADA